MRRPWAPGLCSLIIVVAAMVGDSGCSGPSVVNAYYQHGTYSRRVTPVRVGVFHAKDERPGWPATGVMRIFGPGNVENMWHTEGDKAMSAYVGKALRMELAAAGMDVSKSPLFDQSTGAADAKTLRGAGVERAVFARINYLGFVSPEAQATSAGDVAMFTPLVGLPAAVAIAGARQNQRDGGITFDDDTPSANAYVDIDLWAVDPSSGKIVWADSARRKRSLVVRHQVAEQVGIFVGETLYLALHDAIWRNDFLTAMGASLLPTTASSDSPEAHEKKAKQLYAAERFVDAAIEFKTAYDLGGDPSLLYNLAQCYRRANKAKLALWTYQDYLAKVPGSPQRAAVEKRIAELQAEIGDP